MPAEDVDRLATGDVGPERDVAGHVRQARVQRDAVLPRVAAEQGGGTGVRAQHAEQDAQRRRLARAVGAEEAVRLAALDDEIEAVEGPRAAEALDQAVHGDHRVVAHASFYSSRRRWAQRRAGRQRTPTAQPSR